MPIIIPSSLQLSCLGGFRLYILLCTCSPRGAVDPLCFQRYQQKRQDNCIRVREQCKIL